ncbi:hypothetical protein FS842_009425 [Serendipita sp. 407]|nr:hypothetical protein FS842_009425 [Serendipita sp. 407]
MATLGRFGPITRFILYCLFLLWSILLLVLCIARLAYTDRRRNEPSLNGGAPFYDPSVVELLVCAFLGIVFSQLMIRYLWAKRTHPIFSKNWFEVCSLGTLWLLWLSGAGAASTVWPDLSWCIQYSPCVVLQVLMAWAWLGWITLSLLLFPTLWFVVPRRAWHEECIDTWGRGDLGNDMQRIRSLTRGNSVPPAVPPKLSEERGKSRGVNDDMA